jgi:integrase
MSKSALPRHCYAKRGGVWFQRRGWQTVRFQSAPGTPEFAAEYALILRGQDTTPTTKRTFTALIESYCRDKRWAKLAPRTKADYRKVLDWVRVKLGPLPVDKMQRKDVIRAQAVNADTMRFANYIVQVLRVLMEHAINIGWRTDNPAKGVDLIKSDRPKREAWPAVKVKAAREAAPLGGVTRTIFELCIGTGQRIGDVLRMRWNDLENGGVWVTQAKTKTRMWIPFTAHLRVALEATPKIGLTICAQPNGRPISYRGAADRIMALRKAVGAEAYDLHALRYTTAAELAAAGCSDELIMAITGHKARDMVARYAGPARQVARAKEAQGRRE